MKDTADRYCIMGGDIMPKRMQSLIDQYVEEIKRIYGSHVKQIILYGSYARGDFRPDSDVDIMILSLIHI